MMNPAQLLKDKRLDILRIAARHGAYNVRVFGSLARGEGRPDSDVDILVNLDADRSLLDLIALKQDLEDLPGCKVDGCRPRCGMADYAERSAIVQAAGRDDVKRSGYGWLRRLAAR